MNNEIRDPRIREFGNYLAEEIDNQKQRPYADKKDIEAKLAVYEPIFNRYKTLFSLENQTPLPSISDLDLTVRTQRALERYKLTNMERLLSHTPKELLALHGKVIFGRTSVNELKQKLSSFGLSLKESSE
jgi:DNA-directed RNA polymerase alpha subunit